MIRVEKDGSITVGILPAVKEEKPVQPVAPAEEKPVKKTRKTTKK